MTRTNFDADYYQRFYLDRSCRVGTPESTARLVDFVAAYLRHLGVAVGSVLDLGCGLGWWREPVARNFPGANWTGVEFSPHLCATLGWARGSVVDWRGAGADLVVSQGVLQYLDERDAKRALSNMKRLAHKAIYLETVTEEDWAHTVDRRRSDADIALRPAGFYRASLGLRFVHAGGGLWVRKGEATLFALEAG